MDKPAQDLEALKPFIAKAVAGPLSADEARQAFALLMTGIPNDAQMAAFLIALRTRGEMIEEITAATEIMREKCNRIEVPDGAIDIVGTGGDGVGTLNISTASAFVVAGSGVVVAKHGNRNISSKSGAADLLSALGINVMLQPKRVEEIIRKIGIGFMMAPMHHPAIKHIMTARQALGTRTVFNILGPMTNPGFVKRQLTGAFNVEVLRPMAEVLTKLGCVHGWLVHGMDGADELSITGPSQIVETKDGVLRNFQIRPQDAGLDMYPIADILGRDPVYNAQKFRALLSGEQGAYRDAVLLNSAAALLIAGEVLTLGEGVLRAAKSIDAGHAKAKLQSLIDLSNV